MKGLPLSVWAIFARLWIFVERTLWSQLCAEVCAYAQEIGEYAPGGDRWPGAWSLDNERIVIVATGNETHDVIGKVDVCERVRPFQRDEAHRGASGRRVERADIAEDTGASLCCRETFEHQAIELRKPVEKFVGSAGRQRSWNEAL